ncbi:MAG: GDSL-type esterase/lipase family protein [bacterium]|nr:GDSL-type esterase/lipase family protein [bacterium]
MKYSKITGVAVVLIFIAVALWFGMNRGYDIKNYPSSGEAVIVFGDSLARGVGSTEGNDFVSLLSERINTPIENFGYAGDTTAMALTRIESVLSKNPKVVMVLLGGNDFLRRVPKTETLKNLEQIIITIQDAGAVVILLGVRGGLITDGYESDLQSLAEKTGSAYVPNVLKGLLGNTNYMSDSVHPNNSGYAIIADRIYPILQKVLK